jgi:hypothetical protein
MSKESDCIKRKKCHHCGHEWEPRVKNPKKCPQCQNPLWVSPRPKVKRKAAVPTPIAVSEGAALTPLTTDTSTEEVQSAVSGAVEPENPVSRLQREADERLRRLADAPID